MRKHSARTPVPAHYGFAADGDVFRLYWSTWWLNVTYPMGGWWDRVRAARAVEVRNEAGKPPRRGEIVARRHESTADVDARAIKTQLRLMQPHQRRFPWTK